MKANLEKIDEVQCRMSVELPPEIVNQSFDKVYKKIQKQAKIDGFRQGKAPLPMIKKMYEGHVTNDVNQDLIETHLATALKTQFEENKDLKFIGYPRLEKVESAKIDTEFKFSAILEVLPKVEVTNYKNLSLTSEEPAVDSTEVENELKHLQKVHSKTQTITDESPAKEGDLVEYSCEVMQNHQLVKDLSGANRYIELNSAENPEQAFLIKEIIGLKTADTKNFTHEIKQTCNHHHDHGHDHHEGDHAHEHTIQQEYQLTINNIFKVIPAELNDEFAKDLGSDSLEDLKSKINDQILGRKNNEQKSKLESQAIEQLLKSNNITAPNSIVESCIDEMIAQVPWPKKEDYDRASRDPALRDRIRESAIKRAKQVVLLWQIAETEKISVSDDEVMATLEQEAKRYQKSAKQLFEKIGERVREDLLREKAMQFVMKSATITNMPKS